MQKLILVFLLACAACTTKAGDPAGAGAPPAPVASAKPRAAAAAPGNTLARLQALVADATCTGSDQCRTMAVGANACGGPQSYLPYSTTRTNEKDLRALAERYKAERQAANQASGMVSTCRHIPDPGAVCTSGACQLGVSSSAPR